MKLGNLEGRAALLASNRTIDVEQASGGRFSAEIDALYRDWAGFVGWAAEALSEPEIASAERPFDRAALTLPVCSPRQAFAIGLNYAEHARETNLVGEGN